MGSPVKDITKSVGAHDAARVDRNPLSDLGSRVKHHIWEQARSLAQN